MAPRKAYTQILALLPLLLGITSPAQATVYPDGERSHGEEACVHIYRLYARLKGIYARSRLQRVNIPPLSSGIPVY